MRREFVIEKVRREMRDAHYRVNPPKASCPICGINFFARSELEICPGCDTRLVVEFVDAITAEGDRRYAVVTGAVHPGATELGGNA